MRDLESVTLAPPKKINSRVKKNNEISGVRGQPPPLSNPPVVKSSKNYRDPNRNIRHLYAISGRLRRLGVITILVVKMQFVKGKRNLIRPPKAVEKK